MPRDYCDQQIDFAAVGGHVRKFLRLGVLAIAIGALLVPAVAAPAAATTGSSICSVSSQLTLGTSDYVVGVRVQAFSCDGVALPFEGDIQFVGVFQPVLNRQWVLSGDSTPTAQVSSADGSPIVGLVDIGGLDPGAVMLTYSLTAPGDTAAAELPSDWPTNGPSEDLFTAVSRTATYTGQVADGRSFVPYFAYAELRSEQQHWGCDSIDMGPGTGVCVMNTPTGSDQTWQKGLKVTMTWPDPGADPATGLPYTRCQLDPALQLDTSYVGEDGRTYQSWGGSEFDVPAKWGTYTLALAAGDAFGAGIVPGATSIDVSVWCYSKQGSRLVGEALETHRDELIPDVPPTQPSTVTAVADGTSIDAQAAGSVALGVAPLQGYQMSVATESGTVVASATVPAVTTVQAQSVHAASVKPMHAFARVKPGKYVVRVASFNRVGSSNVVTSRVITVRAPARLSAPRHVKAVVKAARARLSWTAPASTGGGIAKYRVVVRRGSHVVQTATVKASVRRFISKRLARGTYRLTLSALTADGRSASAVRLSVKR